MEEDRTPVGRLDFKSSEGRSTSLVGSTPTLFRQSLSTMENQTHEKRPVWAALVVHVLLELAKKRLKLILEPS